MQRKQALYKTRLRISLEFTRTHGPEDIACGALAPSGTRRAQAGRLNAEVGYGFAPFDTGLLTPYAGTVLAEGADRTYRVGTRLQFPGHGVKGFKLSLEGQRQEASGPQPVNQGLRLQAEWQF